MPRLAPSTQATSASDESNCPCARPSARPIEAVELWSRTVRIVARTSSAPGWASSTCSTVRSIRLGGHGARGIADDLHGQKDQPQRDQALAEAAIDFPLQKLEAEHAKEEQPDGAVFDVQGQQLHRHGETHAAPQQHRQHAFRSEIPGGHHVDGHHREGCRGRGAGPGHDAGEEGLHAGGRHPLEPRDEVGAEQAVQPFAQEAHSENHQRDAAENRDATHFAGSLRVWWCKAEKVMKKV